MNYTIQQIIAIIISGIIIFRISYSSLSFLNRLLLVVLIVVAMRSFVLD